MVIPEILAAQAVWMVIPAILEDRVVRTKTQRSIRRKMGQSMRPSWRSLVVSKIGLSWNQLIPSLRWKCLGSRFKAKMM
jgi:hypothetical protein